MQRTLKREVVVHDDGSAPGMYDLRIGDPTTPAIAIECTGAVDSVATETWNLGHARGPLSTNLKGNWSVTLHPNARVKAIRADIVAVLRKCEGQNLIGFLPVDGALNKLDSPIFEALRRLKVDSIHCYQTDGEGKVHLGMTGIGGPVDKSGRQVPRWIGDFLRAPHRSDVLIKLRRSNASECHVFIPVVFGGVPWPVESYLGSSPDALPPTAPDLPSPVLGVWITYGGTGVRWDGSQWSFFDAMISAEPQEN